MFRTGEFSKISRVSKRLLHHYKNIGLLQPIYTDPDSGYHYYSVKQLPRLNRILALKDLGLTLQQIKKMVDAELRDDEIQGMLLLKKAEMEQALQDDMARLRRIEARLQQNQMDVQSLDVVIKSIPAQQFLSVSTTADDSQEVLALLEQLLRVVPSHVASSNLGPLAGVFDWDGVSVTQSDMALGYFLKAAHKRPVSLSDEIVLQMEELPAVATMATTVISGNLDPALLGLGKIAQWIEQNRYQIIGPYREISFDVATLEDLNGATIEIQVPVRRLE